MRFLATLLLWLLTTAALAVTVPVGWAQTHIVDEAGYAELATSAAHDPALQQAMASELSTQIVALAADRGYDLTPGTAYDVATTYTSNDGFPGQFAQANRIAHRWMFTDSTQQGGSTDQWLIDIAPMLSDPSLQATLGNLDIGVPESLTVPITVSSPELRPGRLSTVSTWGPWISVGAAVLTGLLALLTLAAARSRGKALAALGVSAFLVGGGGWAAVEIVRGRVDDALNRTEGEFRQVADVLVSHAEDSLHHWLNMTLLAGGALVVLGVVVTMLGALLRRETTSR